MNLKPTDYGKQMILTGQLQDQWVPCNGLQIVQQGNTTTFKFLHDGNPILEFNWTGRVSDHECMTVLNVFEVRFPLVLHFD